MTSPPQGDGRAIRVVLVDDQALLRVGFRMILEAQPDIEVVGEAPDGREAVRLATQLEPDVLLMDVRMPVMDGIVATEAVNRAGLATRVLILTTFDLDEYVIAGLRAGASGFLLKDVPPDQLAAAVRTVAAGEALLAPTATRRLLDRLLPLIPESNRREHRDTALSMLTGREGDVFRLLAGGRSNREIAQELHLSEGTVKVHVGHLFAKLELRDRAQAVVLAYELGIVTPGSAELPPLSG